MKKVSVIGHLAKGYTYLDGQTVKTKIVTRQLEKSFGVDEVGVFDTHGGLKTLIKSPMYVWKALSGSQNVVILPAHNGLRVFGRLLPMFRRFFKNRKIHYVVIGGWLAAKLQTDKGLAKALKKFDGIYVETSAMKNTLAAMGFENVFVMPNCKELTVLEPEELVYCHEKPYKLCTFSRVSKEKGIERAFGAVKTVNDRCGETVFTLDIYGQVDKDQIQWFEDLQKQFPPYVQYKGMVAFDKSVQILKDYTMLLFPTSYEGEGFAGTLLDAFAAALPVIASDWKYNGEILRQGEDGFLFSLEEEDALANVLIYVKENPEKLFPMKKQCLKSAQRYSPDEVIQVLIGQLN